MSEILIEQNNDDNTSNNLFEQFDVIINSMNVLKTQITLTQQNLKLLEKNLKKQMKNLKKEVIKNKNKNKGNRKPSGFAKPSKVTKELCYFMNKTEGTEIARTEVTKALVSYIKENKLENDVNSRIISPDNKLKVLLGIEDGEELTYFNIQKYMNKHFVKKEEL
jgi:chromatin remodeling complex protein RSC6